MTTGTSCSRDLGLVISAHPGPVWHPVTAQKTLLPGVYPKKKKKKIEQQFKKYTQSNVHCSTIYNCQDVEAT